MPFDFLALSTASLVELWILPLGCLWLVDYFTFVQLPAGMDTWSTLRNSPYIFDFLVLIKLEGILSDIF